MTTGCEISYNHTIHTYTSVTANNKVWNLTVSTKNIHLTAWSSPNTVAENSSTLHRYKNNRIYPTLYCKLYKSHEIPNNLHKGKMHSKKDQRRHCIMSTKP
jgi:hypothetical protein